MSNRFFKSIGGWLSAESQHCKQLFVANVWPTVVWFGLTVAVPICTEAWRVTKIVGTPVMTVLWHVFAYSASLLSFGALDLKKRRTEKGAIARVWSFFGPFLISTEPLPIGIPTAVALPRFDGWRGGFGTKQGLQLVAYLLATSLFVAWGAYDGFRLLNSLLGTWAQTSIFVIAVVLVLSVIKSLPTPTWQKRMVPLPVTIRGIAFGGRTLLQLPEFCKTWLLLGLVGYAIYLVNHFAVQMNVINGEFMDSITTKDAVRFNHVLWLFAELLAIMTAFNPVNGWLRQMLILDFGKFSMRLMMRLHILTRNVYPLSLLGHPDNPNERIQMDVPAMCSASLQFMLVCIDSLITFYLFGGILWDKEKGLNYEIPVGGHVYVFHHLLLIVLVAYALLGSNGVVRVGWRLIKLLFERKQLGAGLRYGLVMLEKYAEPIAAYRGEQREYDNLWGRFMLTLQNNYAVIRWQRNLGFFTSGYDRVANLLPYGALAPFYFAGKIPFSTISNAVGAFGEILSSASIFVNEFSSLTDLTASINRVGELRDAFDVIAAQENDGQSRIKVQDGELLDIEGMTLFTPDRGKVIVRDFNLHVQPGDSVAIVGPSGSGKTSILRAIIGLPMWNRGEGTVKVASQAGQTLMLTQLAYLPSDANLRQQILYPGAAEVSDEALHAVLVKVNLPDLAERVGGLDGHYNWDSLSGGERQRLVIARALINKVRLVIADEATSGLDASNEERLYQYMVDAGITLVSVTHKPAVLKYHKRIVQLLGDGNGGWRIMPVSESPMHE